MYWEHNLKKKKIPYLKVYLFTLKLMFYLLSLSQLPVDHQTPDHNTPVDLSLPFDLMVFVILPLVVIILLLLWRRKKRQDNNQK